MNTKHIALLFVCAGLAACVEEPLPTPSRPDGTGAEVLYSPQGAIAGQLVVRFSAEAADSLRAALDAAATRFGEPVAELTAAGVLAEAGVERLRPLFGRDPRFEERHRAFGLDRWYEIDYDPALAAGKLVAALRTQPGIEVLEYPHAPRMPRRQPARPLRRDVPQSRLSSTNDPLYSQQWHYRNTGDQTRVAVAGADINLAEAWDRCTGDERIVVAVIDEPVQYTHPDLAQNMWTNTIDPETNGLHGYNFADGSPDLDWTFVTREEQNGQTVDVYADHGTHVAGTVAAVTGNGLGVAGVAGGRNGSGGVKIMSCQIFGRRDRAGAAAKAFVYAADHGALIAQCSYGYGYSGRFDEQRFEQMFLSSSSERTAIDYFIDYAGKNDPEAPIDGGLVIFAAGNDGLEMQDITEYPAAYDRVVSVSAIGSDYLPAYYTCYNTAVDIAAPGGDAYNSNYADAEGNTLFQREDGTYRYASGATYSGPIYYGEDGMVLSTILGDPSIGYTDGRDPQNRPYGYMQGTSMACPHVSGVAALGLSLAAKQGIVKMPVERFKQLLLGAVHPLDGYLTGSKFVEPYNRTLTLSNYLGKMGAGYVDADLLMTALQGESEKEPPAVTAPIPNRLVQTGTPGSNLSLSDYFSDDRVARYAAAAHDESVAQVNVVGATLRIVPKRAGQTRVSVTATGYNGSGVSQTFFVTVRDQTNSSEGWL